MTVVSLFLSFLLRRRLFWIPHTWCPFGGQGWRALDFNLEVERRILSSRYRCVSVILPLNRFSPNKQPPPSMTTMTIMTTTEQRILRSFSSFIFFLLIHPQLFLQGSSLSSCSAFSLSIMNPSNSGRTLASHWTPSGNTNTLDITRRVGTGSRQELVSRTRRSMINNDQTTANTSNEEEVPWSSIDLPNTKPNNKTTKSEKKRPKKVVIIGAGWGGLSAADALSKSSDEEEYQVTVVDASTRIGGLVRDGYQSMNGRFKAEAGQHGFWDQYSNIFRLLDALNIIDTALTTYAPQGQYSPDGLQAIWPIFRNQIPTLPTGLAQAVYTRFENLPIWDRITAFPLVLAFSEFDDSEEAWKKYDGISFRDLCIKLGVSRRCYEEAFEPMILTGLFAPGAECSAAAALGMAYFFVLSNQNAFDVRWCKGNIGEQIMDPWKQHLECRGSDDDSDNGSGVTFQLGTRVTGFQVDKEQRRITHIHCSVAGTKDQEIPQTLTLEADEVIFAVGAAALNTMVRFSPPLAEWSDFRKFANLRGTSVLATRLFLDRTVPTPYTANACWGFDKGVGMTVFDIKELHGENFSEMISGSVLEVDYYHADTLLVMSDEDIVKKVKTDLDTMFGIPCATAQVLDAAIVRLPNAVNWYFPGSYQDMPNIKSESLQNVYFAGDLVKTRHGSWSQEKAFVTGIEAANSIKGLPLHHGIIPLPKDELHVAFGRSIVSTFQKLLTQNGKNSLTPPSLVDFFY